MDKIKQLLPDDMFDSKDWRGADTVERVEYLIARVAAQREEINLWLEQLEWAREDRERLRDALLLTLPFVKKDEEIEAIVHAALIGG